MKLPFLVEYSGYPTLRIVCLAFSFSVILYNLVPEILWVFNPQFISMMLGSCWYAGAFRFSAFLEGACWIFNRKNIFWYYSTIGFVNILRKCCISCILSWLLEFSYMGGPNYKKFLFTSSPGASTLFSFPCSFGGLSRLVVELFKTMSSFKSSLIICGEVDPNSPESWPSFAFWPAASGLIELLIHSSDFSSFFFLSFFLDLILIFVFLVFLDFLDFFFFFLSFSLSPSDSEAVSLKRVSYLLNLILYLDRDF